MVILLDKEVGGAWTLTWCAGLDLDPLNLGRVEIERYVRWLQEVRCYQPSTVSRRLSVVVGFYRVCVIDQILAHSPADYVRRPPMPAESPTLGLGHLQFEALLTTARLSANSNDFALIAMLGPLGLRIFEACGANIGDLGEEHGHRVFEGPGHGRQDRTGPIATGCGDRPHHWQGAESAAGADRASAIAFGMSRPNAPPASGISTRYAHDSPSGHPAGPDRTKIIGVPGGNTERALQPQTATMRYTIDGRIPGQIES